MPYMIRNELLKSWSDVHGLTYSYRPTVPSNSNDRIRYLILRGSSASTLLDSGIGSSLTRNKWGPSEIFSRAAGGGSACLNRRRFG